MKSVLCHRLHYLRLLIGLALLTGIYEVHSQPRLGAVTGTVYLPILGNSEGRSIQLVMTNPDPSEATIRVFGYDDLGAPLNGTSPLVTEFQIGSGRTIQVFDFNLLGLFPGQVPGGWLRIDILNANVSIHVQQRDESGLQTDGFRLSGETRDQRHVELDPDDN